MGTTAPKSGRPRKIKERGQGMLRYTLFRISKLSAESIATNLQALHGLWFNTRRVLSELH